MSSSSFKFKMMKFLTACLIACSFSSVFGQFPINGTCPEMCKPFELNITADQVIIAEFIFALFSVYLLLYLASSQEFGLYTQAFLTTASWTQLALIMILSIVAIICPSKTSSSSQGKNLWALCFFFMLNSFTGLPSILFWMGQHSLQAMAILRTFTAAVFNDKINLFCG